jgi:hypothetical protein
VAETDRRTLRQRREALRGYDMSELAAHVDPSDPTLEGVLYDPQAVELTPTARAALLREPWRLAGVLREAGRLIGISGGPLSSSEPAEFTLDGRTYASVWWFYQALKLAEGDPLRAAAAAGCAGPRRVKPAHRGWFEYGDEQLDVGSRRHGELILRATAAKVLAHRGVQDALAASGSARLLAGGVGSTALGRYMPLALMVMRLKLFHR